MKGGIDDDEVPYDEPMDEDEETDKDKVGNIWDIKVWRLTSPDYLLFDLRRIAHPPTRSSATRLLFHLHSISHFQQLGDLALTTPVACKYLWFALSYTFLSNICNHLFLFDYFK